MPADAFGTVSCAAFPSQICMNNIMVKDNATKNSVRFYILTAFDDSSSFCYEQLLHLFLLKWDILYSVWKQSCSYQSLVLHRVKICTLSTFQWTLLGADGNTWHINLTTEELCTMH